MRDDRAVSLGRSVVECDCRNCRKNRFQPRSSNWCVGGLSIHTALKLHAGDDRHKDSVIERQNPCRYGGVAVTHVNCDVGIKQVSHLETASFRNLFFVPHFNGWRSGQFSQASDHFGNG